MGARHWHGGPHAALRCGRGEDQRNFGVASGESQRHKARAEQDEAAGGQRQEAIGYEVMVAHGAPLPLSSSMLGRIGYNDPNVPS